ncbi:MAG: histidine kinase [Burkholderiales bacterium]|nr:MAG: histidine kinase [Burkholderiales bacterium]TAG79426.1 MAG: histidine kinase [Betaproteobacteria bacterium]
MNAATSSTPLTSYDVALRRARKKAKEIREFYMNVVAYCVVIPVLWLINIFSPGPWWAQWATVGWGLGLTIHGLTVFADGTFFGTAWEEKKIAELMANEQLKVVSSEKQLVQAQMRMLQAQIEPHFLFNTLANIQSLIAKSPDRANLMMDNFIAYLRQSLTASRSQEGTVKQEIDLVRHYLELIKIRMAERLTFAIDIDASLDRHALPPMLLQPVVENAIKHGLEPKEDGGHISIHARGLGGGSQIQFVIADNGLGFGANADSAGTGVGLTNLRERLKVLYDGAASMEITDASPGTSVSITIPAKR